MLNSPLPSVSVVTGESITLDLPINKAIDNEGDSFTSKVTIDESREVYFNCVCVSNVFILS